MLDLCVDFALHALWRYIMYEGLNTLTYGRTYNKSSISDVKMATFEIIHEDFV